MPNYVFVCAVAALVVFLVLRLIRSRTLREKYAALWLVVGFSTIVLVLFPGLLEWATALFGFTVPSNLLFLVGMLLLAAVALQLCREVSVMEDETRVLAEESAIQKALIADLQDRVSGLEGVRDTGAGTHGPSAGRTDPAISRAHPVSDGEMAGTGLVSRGRGNDRPAAS